ncbi:MAG: GNAT family N-acetyltransferase [Methanoregula sp.]
MNPDDISVLRVNSWDSEQIVALYRAGGWWKDEYDPAEIPRLIDGSFAFVVAADKKSGRAVGMGRAISDGVSDAYIQDLVVLPPYRQKNLGSAILTLLISQCRDAGITWIALVAEPGSEQFYLPLGFHRMEGHIPLIYRGDP